MIHCLGVTGTMSHRDWQSGWPGIMMQLRLASATGSLRAAASLSISVSESLASLTPESPPSLDPDGESPAPRRQLLSQPLIGPGPGPVMTRSHNASGNGGSSTSLELEDL